MPQSVRRLARSTLVLFLTLAVSLAAVPPTQGITATSGNTELLSAAVAPSSLAGAQLAPGGSGTVTATVTRPPVQDASFLVDFPTTQAIVTERLWIGNFFFCCAVDVDENYRAALQFDLKPIPPGATVTEARLETTFDGTCLHAWTKPHCGGVAHTIDAHRMTQSWSTSSTTGQLSFDGTVLASDTLPANPGTTPRDLTWDITTTVQDWVDRSVPNHGLILKRSTEAHGGTSGPSFPSSRFTGDPSYRPRLVVTYDLPPASPDTVYYWNEVISEAFEIEGGGPTPLARAAAMMHAGIYDVVNSAWWGDNPGAVTGYSEYLTLEPVAGVADELAAGLAARDILSDALPDRQAFFEQKFDERYGDASQSEAAELADEVASAMIAFRSNDGSDASPSYTFDDVPGAWRLTGHLCTEPVTPHWGQVTPFTLASTTQFRQPLPGGYTNYADLLASSLYAQQLAEVQSLGRYDSTTRTAQQTQIAHFWANDLDGTYKPPGQLLEHTQIVSEALQSGALETARLFAHVSLALADAGIAAWDQKYLTAIDLWRPETAIRLANTDGNSATVQDANWLPLSPDENDARFNPCFPAWVSGHATFAAAWAGVMANWFGDSVSWTATTQDPHAVGVTRQFMGFTAAAEENARSRIYLGVHFQFDADDGLATGYGIADHVYENFLSSL